ncbi:MAG: hypothetical protein SF187_01550 [Deltaproteobacteria bacterium]|nr:hypothetical protein [Deltaproteobacteria bacterium]
MRSWRRLSAGWAALLCFVVGTLVAPAAHIYNHWADHIHTANGVLFLDGRVQAEERPSSLQEVLDEVRGAAFGSGDNDTALAAARFSSSATCRSGTPSPTEPLAQGDGSLLHFGLLFHGCTPSLHPVPALLRLHVLDEAVRFERYGHPHTIPPHIRGPPALA